MGSGLPLVRVFGAGGDFGAGDNFGVGGDFGAGYDFGAGEEQPVVPFPSE